MGLTLEICVEGLASALAALEGGADRIELCETLAVGGVTPSAGAVTVACQHAAERPVQVLIRPRGGPFTATPDEWAAIEHDVRLARDRGAHGVVFGLLRADGTIDVERNAALVALARPMSVTFHRAFDATPDPHAALQTLIDLGIDRVLTTGGLGAPRVAVDRIAALVAQAAGRIIILAGGGVTAADFGPLAAVGVREVHIGSAACRPRREPDVGSITDAVRVRNLVQAARAVATRSSGR